MLIRKILVTGSNGQLGWELGQLATTYPAFEFVLADRNQIDLSHPDTFENIIQNITPDCIINTAAYTAVDKSETEKELAYTINAIAVKELARISKKLDIPFITYSTDYVFDGAATEPYLPTTKVDPVNYYGSTKAAGETFALTENEQTIVIRTSWVFSTHGHNFVKTMLRLMKEKENLNIVADQKGRPTYARDLAKVTMQIVQALNAGQAISGIFHFANQGETTWFDFATKIKEFAGLSCTLNPIDSAAFPTPAKRPKYSVLATQKIEDLLALPIPHWEVALQACLQEFK